MAVPIPLKRESADLTQEIRGRLEHAPVIHADAVLAAYQLLQDLQDRGVLDLLRGLLGAGDDVVTRLAQATSTPEAIRVARNLVSLFQILGSVDPEILGNLAREIRENPPPRQMPGFFSNLAKLGSKDSRRAWGALAYGVQTFGRALVRKGR
jgi:uncharacterized protein YjgD (DUF1641 family)